MTPTNGTKYRAIVDIGYWSAPIFAAVLGVITLTTFWMVRPHSYEAAFPAFFCFLPMAFFFSASAQVGNQRQVRALQQRVAQLEAQNAPL